MRERIAHYELLHPLGEGGMGVVYAARDERLGRMVAIKRLRESVKDETARGRLWREARAAASLSHPNICQVFEVGEDGDQLFVVMELLEGEPLADRIARGAMGASEALGITRVILQTLDAVHRRGIVHRDLKPSNVFLTEHGPKLLDFGLARTLLPDVLQADVALTSPGTVVGTPRYMAPELWSGEDVGPRADLFAVGALLFELLTGKPAFRGNTVVEVYHAIVHEQPPALAGGPEVMGLDRVLQRALAKRPADRYSNAKEMLDALDADAGSLDTRSIPQMHTVTRLIVLPLRVLRADPETDFLCQSLPDAITTSLSGSASIVVRPSAAAASYATGSPDFGRIAREANVDVVIYGSLLRAGDQVQVNCQMVDANSGTVLAAHTTQAPAHDVFRLQDTVTSQMVDAMASHLVSGSFERKALDLPANEQSYQHYLRAKQLANNRRMLPVARDLLQRSLAEDPDFAPAWAHLGRVHRVLAKYSQDGDPDENHRRAEEAFRKALELDPDLSLAHDLYTHFEVEELGRAQDSMLRLVNRIRTHSTDQNLFTGLVVALRFCGLLKASVAADQRARRLDPGVRTSVSYTYLMLGDFENAVLHDDEDIAFTRNYALVWQNRTEEAIAAYRKLEASRPPGLEFYVARSCRAALEGDVATSVGDCQRILDSRFRDPEGLYFLARNLAHLGQIDMALTVFDERVVSRGYWCVDTYERDPWLDPLRDDPRFTALLARAREHHERAAAAYEAAGGPTLLGA